MKCQLWGGEQGPGPALGELCVLGRMALHSSAVVQGGRDASCLEAQAMWWEQRGETTIAQEAPGRCALSCQRRSNS